MKRRVVRNLVLFGAGAGLAMVIGVASAQDAAPQLDEPAHLDRSFGDEGDDAMGGAGTAGMDGGVMKRDGGIAATGRDGGTTMMRRDGGTGGAGEAGDQDAAASDRPTREDHTNIILYGPNGLRPNEAGPNEPDQTGGSSEGSEAPAQ